MPILCYLSAMMIRLLTLACVLAAINLGAWAQGPVADKEAFLIVAETGQNSRKQGMVRTGKILWKCSSRRCVAASKDEPANVEACQALAELVGPLVRFGRSIKPMPSYDLALCNVRAQIKIARMQQERERVLAGRANNKTRRAKPPAATVPAVPPAARNPVARRKAVPMPQADPAIPPRVPALAEPEPAIPMDVSPSFSVRVTRLSILGKGALHEGVAAAAPPPNTGVAVRVEPLEMVGYGRLREVVRGTYLTVKVEKLEVTGK